MILQERPKPIDLQIFNVLLARMDLLESEVSDYWVRRKGYEGELKSDEWLKGLTSHWIVLHGLLLKFKGSKFQIDTLIIAFGKIYLFDVKNFEGDYYFKNHEEGEKWFWSENPNHDIKNPLHQLSRCELLLRKLLQSLGHHYKIESYLIFINPEFHLYISTINPKLIFPTQLNRFLKKLNASPVKLNQTHYQLAQQLAALHIIESPYNQVPSYNYYTVKKGCLCSICRTLSIEVDKEILVCTRCGLEETVDSAVMRNIEEYRLLFPDRKITTKDIYEWCGGILSKKVIRRVLTQNFMLVKKSKLSYYVKP